MLFPELKSIANGGFFVAEGTIRSYFCELDLKTRSFFCDIIEKLAHFLYNIKIERSDTYGQNIFEAKDR